MTSMGDCVARQIGRNDGVGTNQQALKFLQQDYEKLLQECLKSGRLFEDPMFPAESNSLGYKELGRYSSKTKGLQWKRPREFCSNPTFIDNGATRTDICQGELGDCWLLAAIASLTLDQDILARVVPPDQSFTDNYAGIFHFQFWQFGEWLDVVIDDRLPTRNGQLLFVHSAEGNEFWSALLEKAYAKVNGCYEALSGGSTIEGFEDFTGGIAETYQLNKAPPSLFQIMVKALERGSLMGCCIDVTSAYETENVTALGLVKGHAYSVTGAEEVHVRGSPVQLVRIRNPWGNVEWIGPWSDNSTEWKYVSPEEKLRLDNIAEDGEFWMAYSDFLHQYTKLEICNLTPDTLTSEGVGRWMHYQYEGAWRLGSTAGGCRNHPATFCSNPQFLLCLEEVDDDPVDGKNGCTFLVGLMQKDGRRSRKLGQEDLNTIGFAIYKVCCYTYKGQANVHLGPDVLLKQKEVAMCKTFTDSREVCDRFCLPPGNYVIIPSTFLPHKNGNFILRVFSEKHVATRYLPNTMNTHVERSPEHFFSQKRLKNHFGLFNTFNFKLILLSKFFPGADIKTDGFSLETGRHILSLMDRDGSGKLGLVEFHLLWMKILRYLDIFKSYDSDKSGTMSSHEMRAALTQAGFQIDSKVLQTIVNRYASAHYDIDFHCFVDCLIRLEMLFKMFKTLDLNASGKIDLVISQV
uniref:Calpain 8 n=1 Tax=Esox lucius TaxID=8010 RepID=A0A6Q2YUY9_ESOLU